MNNSLALDSRDLMCELRQLLIDLDPATWRAELQQNAHLRLHRIRQDLRELLVTDYRERFATLRSHIEELAEQIEAYYVRLDASTADLRARWSTFRKEVQPRFELVVAGLRDHSVHVPSLRPTNYTRNLFHVGNAAVAAVAIALLSSATVMTAMIATIAGTAWTLEYLRRDDPRLNTWLMALFSKVSHPHEAFRVNSATWFSTALLIVSLTGDPLIMTISVVILGVGDPAAAIVGRRFGRLRLANGRSLEGTLAFVLFGALATLAVVLPLYGDDAYPWPLIAMAILAATVAGSIAEMFSRRIDDNLTIAVASAAVAWGVLAIGL
ncbi:MAG: hypothetical protein A2289_03515 [Deltaproteobacteria bacterium RIFOXYA12_FULL_58_15]|nr:MAG: hypothetical protein A2289_03515 [Deltaproteobacteria bacterium RIFOXYA12_FULL_58_15]OGR14251.1 MAG: hypothetical protein A2341_13610 [Deltaproteobacteria bacterium RIFOXYB12_FULL_58_9]